MEVVALSLSVDEEQTWIRGWQFSLCSGENEEVELRYIDAQEMSEIRRLLAKASDESAGMGYEYHSMEGIIFKKFHSNQRISFLTPGVGLRIGVEGAKIVEELFAFMESSAKLWE